MQRYLIVISSFIIMLCLGGVYAWSIFVPELQTEYGFSALQTQLVFGFLIAVFTITMIFAGKLVKKLGARILGILSALFFALGYLLSSLSEGNFLLIFLGIAFLAGIGTGFGYLISLTTPVKWFPDKKGLITGIAAAGFGLAALVLSTWAEGLMNSGVTVLQVFSYIGIIYGAIIFFLSFFMKGNTDFDNQKKIPFGEFGKNPLFIKLFLGIFAGTFAGLLVIGSLKPIGEEYPIDDHTLILGVSAFAAANFAGRIFWGFISDYIGATVSIFLALLFQSISIFFLGYLALTPAAYMILSVITGFTFGANFVLFARETSQFFGIGNLAPIYPYVFLGYGLAGILGPMTGGFLVDTFGNYFYATTTAAVISMFGSILFLLNIKKDNPA